MTDPVSIDAPVTSGAETPTRFRRSLVGPIRQLARFEGTRLLRHPLNLAGSIGSIVVFWLATLEKAPVLEEDVITLAGSCLLLGAAALLTAEAVAGRDARHSTEELVDAMPLSGNRRHLGLVAACWAPLALTGPVLGLGILWLHLDAPAGSIDWLELAAGPAVVILAHVAGVLVGSSLRFPLAGIAVLLGVGALYGLSQVCVGCGDSLPPPSPFLPWHASLSPLPQSAGRVPGVHLAYVVALTGLLASLAKRYWKATAVSAAVVVAAALGLAGTPDSMDALAQRADDWAQSVESTCVTRQTITYCALLGFKPWVDRWEAVVSGVDRAVPEGVDGVRVIQVLDQVGTGEGVAVGTNWTRTGIPNPYATDLAILLASSSLGLPANLHDIQSLQPGVPECLRQTFIPVFGEARGAALLVIAGLASAETNSYLQTRAAAVSTESQEQFGYVLLPGPEIALAGRILNRPADETVDILDNHWDTLVDPDTPVAELARWFEEPAPPSNALPPSIDQERCECTSSGGVRCVGQSP